MVGKNYEKGDIVLLEGVNGPSRLGFLLENPSTDSRGFLRLPRGLWYDIKADMRLPGMTRIREKYLVKIGSLDDLLGREAARGLVKEMLARAEREMTTGRVEKGPI